MDKKSEVYFLILGEEGDRIHSPFILIKLKIRHLFFWKTLTEFYTEEIFGHFQHVNQCSDESKFWNMTPKLHQIYLFFMDPIHPNLQWYFFVDSEAAQSLFYKIFIVDLYNIQEFKIRLVFVSR